MSERRWDCKAHAWKWDYTIIGPDEQWTSLPTLLTEAEAHFHGEWNPELVAFERMLMDAGGERAARGSGLSGVDAAYHVAKALLVADGKFLLDEQWKSEAH